MSSKVNNGKTKLQQCICTKAKEQHQIFFVRTRSANVASATNIFCT